MGASQVAISCVVLSIVVLIVGVSGGKYRKLTPTERFKVCCERGAPRAYKGTVNQPVKEDCLEKYCNYEIWNRKVFDYGAYLGTCPGLHGTVVFWCAGRSRDHKACCAANGVPDNCSDFCHPGAPTKYDVIANLLPCQPYFNTIKQCFYDYELQHPTWVRQRNAQMLSLSDNLAK